MSPMPLRIWEEAQFLKERGNFYYDMDRIDDAIDAYTKAIRLLPDVVVYWTNRALCYRKRKQWDKVEYDCNIAIKLNTHSVKAHYMLGLVFVERRDYIAAVKELEKALELESRANPWSCMAYEIWKLLARAKYMEWEDLSRERSLMRQKLRETCQKALVNYCSRESKQVEDGSEETVNESWQLVEQLNSVFERASQPDMPTEVPDYLCCIISRSIFRDPVITPCGYTYEKVSILRHLDKVGKFEPLTKKSLEQNQLVPNIAMKQAVRAFLDEHGWAYKGVNP